MEKIVLTNKEWTYILNNMSKILINPKKSTLKKIDNCGEYITISDFVYIEEREKNVKCSVVIDVEGCKMIMKMTDRNPKDFSAQEWIEYISGELEYIAKSELFIELLRDSFKVEATIDDAIIDIDRVLFDDESKITLYNMGVSSLI